MKEYIFMYNTNNKAILNYLKEFMGDEILIQEYGIIGGNPVDYVKSIWATNDSYKNVYAIVNSPAYNNEDETVNAIYTRKMCEEWMQHWIDNGAVHKE